MRATKLGNSRARRERSSVEHELTSILRQLTTPPREADPCEWDSCQNVLYRGSHGAFGDPHLNQFSEEALCPFDKRQFGRKAGF